MATSIALNQRTIAAQRTICDALARIFGDVSDLLIPVNTKRGREVDNTVAWERLADWLSAIPTEPVERFEADEFLEDADDEDAPALPDEPEAVTSLDDLTLAELKALAASAGIEVEGRTKAAHIEALRAHGADA